MPAESPFREEDLLARVEALRVERDDFRRTLEVTLAEAASYRPWSWGRFLLGACVLPGLVGMVVVCAVLTH